MEISRRNLLKGLGTIPFFGAFGWAYATKKSKSDLTAIDYLKEMGFDFNIDVVPPSYRASTDGQTIKLGIIGNGWRGAQILRALGYADPSWYNKHTTGSVAAAFHRQPNLNIQVTAICDTFSVYVDNGLELVKNSIHPDYSTGQSESVKGYVDYRDLLADSNVDAVMILTPDHWHAAMAIDAIKAGKHVYLEKPMTRTAEEANALRDTVNNSNLVFQLGHQNRQQVSHILASHLLKQGIVGKVSLIETSTNRNSEHGAWKRGIHPKGTPETINWKLFLGDAPWHPFDPDRYFNWQKWFEYGTSVAGNQFTHYFDAINQIINLGIPASAMASGGTYYYNDPRNIPDVFHATYEYPERELSLTYSASLANSKHQGKLFRGTEGTMDVGDGLLIEADKKSDKYKSYIDQSDSPTPTLYSFDPSESQIDAVASATAQFYNKQGVMYTYIDGEMLDVTHLHIKEWLDCIRNGGVPSCNIQQGFEETITFRMANISYLEQRMVRWDPVQKIIV
jgi:predicted dehydrogenase